MECFSYKDGCDMMMRIKGLKKSRLGLQINSFGSLEIYVMLFKAVISLPI